MKKLLALVLALVMSMSLVTISNAAFKDADKITADHEEAVEVMNAIGVLVGDEKGNFNAKENLTREQAAKIISYLLLGNKTAEALVGAAKFTDVAATRWSAGFVDYCASTGVVAGNGNGTFAPAGQLTGFQFAKMLLVALGYDANIEGFTGTDWQINVSKVANQVGLFNGLSISGTAALTREQAAQMCLNTIKAPLVQYSNKGGNVTINGAVIGVSASNAEYVTTTLAKEQRISKATLSNTKEYTVEFGEKYYPSLVLDDGTDDFGRPANVWTIGTKDIGTYVNDDLKVVEYTVEVKGKAVYSDINYKSIDDYDLTWYVDGVDQDNAKTNDTASMVKKLTKSNTDEVFASGKGTLTQIFVDDDAKEITVVTINTYLAETDEYNEKKETLSFNEVYAYDEAVKDVKLEDIATIDEYKDGDMVLVTIADGVVKSIVKAEVVEDVEIDEFAKGKYVKAGEKYEYAEKALYDSALLKDYDDSNLDDKTFNIYLDQYGYMIGLEKVSGTTQYVFIAAYDRPTSHLTNKTAEALAIFTDGTAKTISVNVTKSIFADNNNWVTEAGDEQENTWYKYTVKGDTYKLEYTDKQFHDTTSEKIGAKNVSLYDATNKNYYYGNAKTNYITADLSEVNKKAVVSGVDNFTTGVKNVSIDLWTVANKDSSKILNAAGKNADNVGTTEGAFCVYKNGYIIAAVVIGDNGATSDSYAYIYGGITNERYVKAEDVYYWSVKAVVAGEVTSITFKSDLPSDELEMDLYKVSYDANGYAVNAEKATCKQDKGNDYDWIDYFNPDNTKLISTDFGTQSQAVANLKADGETLWVTQQSAKRGFALADDCKAVIVELNQAGTKVDKAVEYSSVAKAIKALDTYVAKTESANFDGRLILTVKDGIVTSVILTDTVNPEKDNVVNGVKASLKVSADGKGLTLVTENLDKAASFKVIAKDIRSGNTGVVNTGDIAANTQYTKVLEQTDGTMTYTVELTVGNKTISVSL